MCPSANVSTQAARAQAYWVKSGRAESEGRLEQWQEYMALQEQYALQVVLYCWYWQYIIFSVCFLVVGSSPTCRQ